MSWIEILEAISSCLTDRAESHTARYSESAARARAFLDLCRQCRLVDAGKEGIRVSRVVTWCCIRGFAWRRWVLEQVAAAGVAILETDRGKPIEELRRVQERYLLLS